MYVLQHRYKDSEKYGDTISYGKKVEAKTVSGLVRLIVSAEFNPQELSDVRVVKRIPVEPVVTFRDEEV